MEHDSDRPRKLEFEPRLLALFLFIAIPFILIGSLLIMNMVRNDVNNKIGDSLAELAAVNARYLDSYILLKVTSVSRLAVAPSLLAQVVAANRLYPASPEVAQKRMIDADEEWRRSGGVTPRALDIVERQTSQFLRRFAGFNPAYREILLTDERGALIAATSTATDFLQADEPWWQTAYGDGETGTIYVSNVRFDSSARAYGIDVAVPVRVTRGDYEVVGGVLKALIDVRDLFAVLGAVKVGDSGRALLVNAADRTIINSDDPDEVMKNEHPGFVHLTEALADGRRTFICQHKDGSAWLTGFSRMPEPAPYPELNWYVVVEQLVEEAQAPTQAATTHLLLFFGLMVLLVLIFSLYMHFRLVRPIREIDLREEMDRVTTGTPGSKPA
jgi:hypothetical protein